MGLFFENVQMALSSIKANKMRSFLTMLGIIIGITSVITIISLSNSISSTMDKFFNSFGKNRVAITINYKYFDDGIDEIAFITKDDVEILKDKFKDDLLYISPAVNQQAQEVKVNNNISKTHISGIDYNYFNVIPADIKYGRALTKEEVKSQKKVIIINKQTALDLFKKENAVGEKIKLKIQSQDDVYNIVGVYDKEKTVFDNMQMGGSQESFVPYSIFDNSYNSSLDIVVKEDKSPDKVGKAIAAYLARYKHQDKEEFYRVISLKEQVQSINSLFATVSIGLGAIAAISLLVGGIGIMNIMLVSVTERTREIGIRKSLGARNKDILLQFLTESLVLSAVGGIIGTALGIGLSFIASALIKTEFAISISSIVIAVGFSAFVGMFFGIFPANKAAKLDPIEALRYE